MFKLTANQKQLEINLTIRINLKDDGNVLNYINNWVKALEEKIEDFKTYNPDITYQDDFPQVINSNYEVL